MSTRPQTSQPKTISLFTKIVVALAAALILFVIVASVLHNMATHGSALSPNALGSSQVQREMDKLSTQVALDAEKQYEIAKRSGSATDAYVNAGLVAAAYLQAKDEPNYKKWKGIETEEAKRAGISVP